MQALVSPEFSLTTGWTELSVTPHFDGMPLTQAAQGPTISATSDDVLFLGSQNLGVWSYDMTKGAWKWVSLFLLVPAIPVAAVGPNSVYAGVGVAWDGPETPVTISRYDNGQTRYLLSLPNNDFPQEIAADSSALPWVLGRSGQVYRWSGSVWIPVESGSFAIQHLSMAGVENIWAVAEIGSERKLARYAEGQGWQVDATFPAVAADFVAACQDGSVWVVSGRSLYLRVAAGDPWQLLAAGLADSTTVSGFTASSQYRCYALVTDADGDQTVQCLSLGVVDRAPVAWPSMTESQSKVYQAICWYVGGTRNSNIRALYGDQLADLDILYTTLDGWGWQSFESWYAHNMGPSIPSQEDWQKTKDQIARELRYAQSVRTLQRQIKDLTNQIAIVNDAVMPGIWGVVGLTEPQGSDGGSSIGLWLGGLVEAIGWAIATVFTDGLASFAAAAAASMLGTGISALQGGDSRKPNRSNALTIKYAQLTDTIAKLYLDTNRLTDTTCATIVQDWGMLLAVGTAIESGKWFWTETASDQLAAASKTAFEISFFQSLVPAKWQILYTRWGHDDQFPWTYTPVSVTYTTPVPLSETGGIPVENVWFCNLLGNPSHVSRAMDQNNFQPYPDPALFDALTKLGVDLGDFFMGRNGWKLQTETLVFE